MVGEISLKYSTQLRNLNSPPGKGSKATCSIASWLSAKSAASRTSKWKPFPLTFAAYSSIFWTTSGLGSCPPKEFFGSGRSFLVQEFVAFCGAIRSKSWSHPRLQNRNLSWAMVGWCIITSTKSKTKQWDPGFWLALVGFIGLGPSFHPLQNRNLNWAIFERSRGEENKRQFVNHNKG